METFPPPPPSVKVPVKRQFSLDIITQLPQGIIEKILCLLPIEEAARTSILSRNWRYKWTSIPKLVFDDLSFDDDDEMSDKEMISKFFLAIYHVLLLHQGPINEFTIILVCVSTSTDISCFLNQIILYLSKNHPVKKLKLEFRSCYYELPLSVFSSHHLENLHLSYCDIHRKSVVNGFGSLTSLSLDSVKISRQTFLHLLSSSPSLKSLYLCMDEEDFSDEVPNIVEIFDCLPAIENLTIQVLVADLSPQKLPISLIYLKYVYFEYVGRRGGNSLTVVCVVMKCSPNVEKIKLQFYSRKYSGDELEKYSAILKKYSDIRLEHLNELKIRDFAISTFKVEFVKFILARSPNLKKLIMIDSSHDNREVDILIVLLRTLCASRVEIIVKKDTDDED